MFLRNAGKHLLHTHTHTHTLSLSLSLSLLLLPLWSRGHPQNALFHFGFLIVRQLVGLLGRGISPSQGRHLHKQNNRGQTSMPWAGFEPTITVFERAKTVHALDGASTVIGICYTTQRKIPDASNLHSHGNTRTSHIRRGCAKEED
jgi:hypothetical protein